MVKTRLVEMFWLHIGQIILLCGFLVMSNFYDCLPQTLVFLKVRTKKNDQRLINS